MQVQNASIASELLQCHNVGMDGARRLGDLIKDSRMRQGMDQRELASLIGRDNSFISRLETGRISNTPDARTIHDLHKALRLSKTEMLRALGYLDEEAEIGDIQQHDDLASIPVPVLSLLRQIEDWPEWQIQYMIDATRNMMSIRSVIGEHVRSERLSTKQTVITSFGDQSKEEGSV